MEINQDKTKGLKTETLRITSGTNDHKNLEWCHVLHNRLLLSSNKQTFMRQPTLQNTSHKSDNYQTLFSFQIVLSIVFASRAFLLLMFLKTEDSIDHNSKIYRFIQPFYKMIVSDFVRCLVVTDLQLIRVPYFHSFFYSFFFFIFYYLERYLKIMACKTWGVVIYAKQRVPL